MEQSDEIEVGEQISKLIEFIEMDLLEDLEEHGCENVRSYEDKLDQILGISGGE